MAQGGGNVFFIPQEYDPGYQLGQAAREIGQSVEHRRDKKEEQRRQGFQEILARAQMAVSMGDKQTGADLMNSLAAAGPKINPRDTYNEVMDRRMTDFQRRLDAGESFDQVAASMPFVADALNVKMRGSLSPDAQKQSDVLGVALGALNVRKGQQGLEMGQKELDAQTLANQQAQYLYDQKLQEDAFVANHPLGKKYGVKSMAELAARSALGEIPVQDAQLQNLLAERRARDATAAAAAMNVPGLEEQIKAVSGILRRVNPNTIAQYYLDATKVQPEYARAIQATEGILQNQALTELSAKLRETGAKEATERLKTIGDMKDLFGEDVMPFNGPDAANIGAEILRGVGIESDIVPSGFFHSGRAIKLKGIAVPMQSILDLPEVKGAFSGVDTQFQTDPAEVTSVANEIVSRAGGDVNKAIELFDKQVSDMAKAGKPVPQDMQTTIRANLVGRSNGAAEPTETPGASPNVPVPADEQEYNSIKDQISAVDAEMNRIKSKLAPGKSDRMLIELAGKRNTLAKQLAELKYKKKIRMEIGVPQAIERPTVSDVGNPEMFMLDTLPHILPVQQRFEPLIGPSIRSSDVPRRR